MPDRRANGGTRPFLRWPGAKRVHVAAIAARMPSKFGTYFEPFLGAGSMFFHLQPSSAVLGDRISRLISVYRAVRARPSFVAAAASRWPVDRDTYYRVRGLTTRDRFERAAQFIYLNKTCWNGLYRVNADGMFNVPYGRPKTSYITDGATLRACALALSNNVRLLDGDFAETLESCGRGDLVYLDPPYVTGHLNNGFVDYNERLFSWADQERLAETVHRLAARGVHVVVTNADHAEVRELYRGLTITTLARFSTLAGSPAHRRPVTEILITSSGPDS